MSSVELSLAISRLVSRIRSGEIVDIAGSAEALAAQYPQLGLSAELIGKAIARAVEMLGVTSADGSETSSGSINGAAAAEGAPDGYSGQPSSHPSGGATSDPAEGARPDAQ